MLSRYFNILQNMQRVRYIGLVTKIVGMSVESKGPQVKIGEVCYIYTIGGENRVFSQVIGFNDERVFLMPFGDMEGIAPGSKVYSTGVELSVNVTNLLLGRIVNGLGQPIDQKGKIPQNLLYTVDHDPPNPLYRKKIREPLSLGIKAIDGLLSVGKGQRIGIFAGSGVGKSTLLGMIARNTKADINVICLIGERGREVREFIDSDLGPEGLERSVVVVATSDRPALERVTAAQVATAIAEFFRNQGKDVMLMMDSLTRFSMAQREVGLAVGEPPVARGYTPSVYSKLPRLLERAGTSDKGTITALYTVLVDGDDMNEPIADTVRGILDGHIVLSRAMANKAHYPAIDVLQSISRVMPLITDENQVKDAMHIKELIATYRDSEDLINIGAYASGSNPKIDLAIEKQADINDFLRQGVNEKTNFDDARSWLHQLANS